MQIKRRSPRAYALGIIMEKSEESNLYNQDFSCYWHSRVYDNIPGNER